MTTNDNKQFKIGDEVKYIGKSHEICPSYFPRRGTIGVILRIIDNSNMILVQWKHGSTSYDDRWLVPLTDIELKSKGFQKRKSKI